MRQETEPLNSSSENPRIGVWLIGVLTAGMAEDSGLREHLLNSAIYMRPITMGMILLLVLRFSPRGLIPEETGARR